MHENFVPVASNPKRLAAKTLKKPEYLDRPRSGLAALSLQTILMLIRVIEPVSRLPKKYKGSLLLL
jgi:hypothetical protein